jgi:serine/threonine protein phosphatase PrpC
VEPGARHGETSAKINQDRGAVCFPFADSEQIALFSVFDGHGVHGDKVSHFTMNTLQAILEDHPLLQENTPAALKHAFLQCDSLLKQEPSIDAELSGTTAVVTVMRGSRLYIANVGDSRAVLARRLPNGKVVAVDLTEDQKPDTPAEMARIQKKKGFVSPPEEEWGGYARARANDARAGCKRHAGRARARARGSERASERRAQRSAEQSGGGRLPACARRGGVAAP